VSEAARRLTLVRHAKASTEPRGGSRDFERPLAPRGEQDAARMGERLARAGVMPDRIVASTARRAAQTADAVARAIGYPTRDIERNDAVYMASRRELVERVEATDASVRHLLLVGHNPGMSELWGWLTGDLRTELPTCGIARLELETPAWDALFEGCARLIDFDYPKRDP